MRRLALTITLACLLSGLARAGEMHPTGVVAPPPPPSTVTASEESLSDDTAPGEIHPTGATALTIILTLISIVP